MLRLAGVLLWQPGGEERLDRFAAHWGHQNGRSEAR